MAACLCSSLAPHIPQLLLPPFLFCTLSHDSSPLSPYYFFLSQIFFPSPFSPLQRHIHTFISENNMHSVFVVFCSQLAYLPSFLNRKKTRINKMKRTVKCLKFIQCFSYFLGTANIGLTNKSSECSNYK